MTWPSKKLARSKSSQYLCRLLFSRCAPSDRHRSERLFETVAGEPLFIRYKTVGCDDFRKCHSGSVGTCQDVLRALLCLCHENGRTPCQSYQRVFPADRSCDHQNSNIQPMMHGCPGYDGPRRENPFRETLRGRIAKLEELEARGAATPDFCEMLVDLHDLLDELYRMMFSERAGKTSH